MSGRRILQRSLFPTRTAPHHDVHQKYRTAARSLAYLVDWTGVCKPTERRTRKYVVQLTQWCVPVAFM